MKVRVALGRGTGAVGIVHWRRSKWGHAVVEVDPTSRKLAGEWIDVPWWRLAPPRRRSRTADTKSS